MNCFCIRKKINTGGSAATIEPADTRCHCATQMPLSEFSPPVTGIAWSPWISTVDQK